MFSLIIRWLQNLKHCCLTCWSWASWQMIVDALGDEIPMICTSLKLLILLPRYVNTITEILRVLCMIGPYLWFIRVQTQRWRHCVTRASQFLCRYFLSLLTFGIISRLLFLVRGKSRQQKCAKFMNFSHQSDVFFQKRLSVYWKGNVQVI